MKNYFKLSMNIIALFAVAIIASFIPECFREFFGDWKCQGNSINDKLCFYIGAQHDTEWHWGGRHYLWFLMSLTLFTVQCVRIIVFVNKNKFD